MTLGDAIDKAEAGQKLLCDSGLYAYAARGFPPVLLWTLIAQRRDVVGRKYLPGAESSVGAYGYRDRHLMATVHIKGLEGVWWHRTLFIHWMISIY